CKYAEISTVPLLARKSDFLNPCIAGNMYLVGTESVCFSLIDPCRFARRPRDVIFPSVKFSAIRTLVGFFLLPGYALATNSVVNLSHYDLMRPDFVGMANSGIVGVIHEATYPRLQRDARYDERQRAALEAGLLWGAYHFGDGTNP